MRAVVQDRYGPPALLRIAEVPRPRPGPDQVLVRAYAASVHADVWHVVRGLPLALRVMGAGLRRPAEPIPGTDVAGIVAAVGSGVTRFRPGDPVFGEVVGGFQWRNGATFAEYVPAAESALEPIPPGSSCIEAAAVPTSGLIALYSVRNEGRVQPGDRVLVNGAAGGVGQMVAQIARAQGAHVTGVERPDRLDLLDEVGVDDVIDGLARDYTAGPDRYDVVIDIPGNRSFAAVRRVLSERGRYVLVGHDRYGAAGHRWLGSLPRAVGLMARSAVSPQVPRPDFGGPGPGGMATLAELLSRGEVRPVIGHTFPLDQAAEALQLLESGQARGKVMLTMTPPAS